MFRQTTLTFALSLASILLTSDLTATETPGSTARNDEQTAYAIDERAANCDVRREDPDQSASVAIFTDNAKHLLLHATGDNVTGTGRLLAYPVDRANGKIGPPLWDASRLLPAAATRTIVTTNSDGSPVAFRWTALDEGRHAQLQDDPAVVEYARGDASNEGSRFRERRDAHGPNRLGAIIESSPLLVGPPAFAYRDELETAPYSAFSRAYAQRPAYVFVGTNNGMLHAIDARTGVEAFAVVPGAVFPRIGDLLRPTAADSEIVDGSPSVGDAFVGGRWRTVLLTGLGRGIVALDVTDPSNYSSLEAQPDRLILWEFADPELGLTYAQPVVAKLQNGAWAAIFGNGYAAAGGAVLYVVDLATGKIIRKLDVSTSDNDRGSTSRPNGLFTPAAVDHNGDRIVDYVYAGDLRGNLWKFDLSSTVSAEWKIALHGEPLYQARSGNRQPQPITSRPEVVRGAKGTGLFVLFAAGNDRRWALPAPPLAPDHATLYGIADHNNGMVRREQLSARSLSDELALTSAGGAVRAARAVRIEGSNAAEGWYLDFLAADSDYRAEQILTSPYVRDATVTLMTRRARKDVCSDGGVLWTTSLDIFDAELRRPLFDVNMDGSLDLADALHLEIKGQVESFAANGLAVPAPLSTMSGSIASMEAHTADHACRRFIYVPRTSSEEMVRITQSCKGPRGRQSWRQVR